MMHMPSMLACAANPSCHPVTEVFVKMDSCHMLKLARTMLQAHCPITSTTGQISLTYIVHLNDVQAKDGLHADNKVPDEHVSFNSQKVDTEAL